MPMKILLATTCFNLFSYFDLRSNAASSANFFVSGMPLTCTKTGTQRKMVNVGKGKESFTSIIIDQIVVQFKIISPPDMRKFAPSHGSATSRISSPSESSKRLTFHQRKITCSPSTRMESSGELRRNYHLRRI